MLHYVCVPQYIHLRFVQLSHQHERVSTAIICYTFGTVPLKLVWKVRLIVPRAYIVASVAYCIRHYYLCTIGYAQLLKFFFSFFLSYIVVNNFILLLWRAVTCCDVLITYRRHDEMFTGDVQKFSSLQFIFFFGWYFRIFLINLFRLLLFLPFSCQIRSLWCF